ncbi:acetylcholinesterase-like [Ptychodera flava]|uniref:acetylcholinesterase-like n=1 Tax=Ptychodera flava TaxID=63121 RepID=UPI003969EBDA
MASMGHSFLFITVISSLLLHIVSSQNDGEALLTIPQGSLRGIRKQLSNTYYVNSFLKIPYVQPALGDLRFRAPQPAPTWKGVRDATRFGPACTQGGFIFDRFPIFPVPLPGLPVFNSTISDFVDEDCLHLNVYAPEVTVGTNRYSVMLFIQGGGYILGGDLQPLYNGEVLAYRQQVVVVTFNYRLGAFGFLSLNDDVAPGNYGLLDQVAAMKWVRDNIEYFGGDPDQVTIFGESAGAASVGMHMISPMSKGLFRRAIAESGTPLNHWAIKEEPYDCVKNARYMATRIGCPTESSTALVECLRTKDALEISRYSFFADGDEFAFEPVVDGPGGFMPLSPIHYIRNGLLQKVPFIMGYNKDELGLALMGVPDIENGMSRTTFRERIWERIVMRRKYGGEKNASYDDIFNAIEFQYTPWDNPNDQIKLRESFIQLTTDRTFVEGILKHIDYATEVMPTYLYRLDYRSIFSSWPEWAGVCHGDELTYIFGLPFKEGENYTDTDRAMSDTVMSLWANFAKTGNPTPRGVTVPNLDVKWERYTASDRKLLIFGPDGTSYMTDDVIDYSNIAFWHVYDNQVVDAATSKRCNCSELCEDPYSFASTTLPKKSSSTHMTSPNTNRTVVTSETMTYGISIATPYDGQELTTTETGSSGNRSSFLPITYLISGLLALLNIYNDVEP